MNTFYQNSNTNQLIVRQCQKGVSDQSGSILIYIVVVMLIFGFLGAGMISMFTASTMMSSGVPNYARNAGYLAEAGVRYATSELRNNGYTKGNISTLNTTPYTLDNGNSFSVNVFGKWFEPVADYNAGSGTLSLSTPQWNASMGQFPNSTITTDDFDIPANAWVVNLEGYRDSQIYKIYGSTPDKFTAEIQGVAYSSINITLTDDFQANEATAVRPADPVCLAVKYTGATPQNPGAGGVLKLPLGAEKFFPEKYGSFHVTDTMEEKRHYFYETLTNAGFHIELSGLSEAVSVSQNDYIILSPRNHTITATGASGSTVSGGENFYTANYRQNIASPQDIKPPSMDLPSDMDTATALAGMTVAESDSAAVDVNTVTGEITLGSNVYNTYGSAFFGGDVSLGGASVCSGGKCVFGDGMRAFFVVDYTGNGDGFTFAVINGTDNGPGASGIGADRLGYAGVGFSGGIKSPKMALEFDTHVNETTRDDPDLGASPPTNHDVLQYVFWGEDATDLNDDNIHDLGGGGQKWSPYLPASNPEDIRTKPALNNAETRLYFTSKNGYLHAVDPFDGSATSGFPVRLDGDPTESSPALDSNGLIFTGGDNEYLNAIKPTGTLGTTDPDYAWSWWQLLDVEVRSSPVIDSNDVIYIGDDNGYFYAFDNSCPAHDVNFDYLCPPDRKSPFAYPGLGNAVDGTPTLSPDLSTVYFVSKDTNFLYALNTSDLTLQWKFSILGVSESSPTVDPDDGTIYVGSNGSSGTGHLYAVNPNNTQKWRYDFNSDKPKSRPAIGPDGTIYIGNDDDYLYAITDDDTQGTLKWRYLTGGNVKGGPTVHDDGTIWFGADENYVYVLDADGRLIDKHPTGGHVKSSPTQGSDGTVYVGADDRKLYAYKATCFPQNIKTRTFSYDDLYDAALTNNAVEDLANVTDADDWLNSGRWAVRIEITRSTTPNARGRYEYTLHTWARQCDIDGDTTCNDIATTYFADTRIEYAAQDPHLEQTAELCASDHNEFNTFLYGFTEGTGGGGTQTVVLNRLELSFIRPGDAVITSDPNWDWQ